ncbi:hypothetical protein NL529_28990, partial [Klebsiella pneumoniae]|nr:hypothetical protein [Klebsiella pneumoniae]
AGEHAFPRPAASPFRTLVCRSLDAQQACRIFNVPETAGQRPSEQVTRPGLRSALVEARLALVPHFLNRDFAARKFRSSRAVRCFDLLSH